jgi:tetratricopeptide (TPR) repeat protein
MKKLLVITAAFLLASCSADIVKEKSDIETVQARTNNAAKAMEYFINGQILDTQDKYDEAVLEFNKALELDKSGGIYYSVALDYFRLNKLAWAKQAAENAIESDKTNKEYMYLLASIYETARTADSAAVCYEKILKLDSLDLRANYGLAEIYKANKPSKSLEIYNRLLRALGPSPEVLFEIASINERLGNTKQTIRTIEDLLKLNPSDSHLKKILIESYLKEKDFEKALKLIDDELVAYPDDFNLLGYKGEIYSGQGEWEKAKDAYLKIVKNPAVNYNAKIKIGAALMDQSKTDSLAADAAKYVFEAVDKDTSDWQVKFYLAEINLAQKHDSLAIEYYKQSSQAADWNVEVWGRFGGLLFDKGKYADLKTEMEKAIKIFPDNYAINLLYGLSFAQTNDHKGAKPYLKKAIDINPTDVMALSALGFSLNQLKEEDEALKYFNIVLSLKPDDTQVLGMAGMIYENRKDYEQSDKLYKQALAIDSTDVLILNNYAYSLSERGTDLDKALNMAKIAVAKEPKNSSYLDTIGWIYFKMGEYRKAAKYITEALKNGEKSVAIYEHLGDVNYKLNKKQSALENWKKALEIEPENEKIKLKIEKGLQ